MERLAETMRLGVFAADAVGAEVARFLRREAAEIACLVLDERDVGARNLEIAAALGAPAEATLSATDLTTDEGLSRLRAAAPDLILLAWWPRLLSANVLAVPRLGTLNLHPSLLPYNRGKHYYFWSIVERAPFGVTIHWVELGIDTGPIAFQRRIETSWTDTGASLYRKAREAMVALFRDSWPAIRDGRVPRVPQDERRATYHRAPDMNAASRIDIDGTYIARDLLDLLRARTFPPDGGVCFTDGGHEYRVLVDIQRVSGRP